MIKAIIFDCFGVLVGRGFNETYKNAGGDPARDRLFIDDILDKANLGMISQSEFKDSIAKKIGVDVSRYEEAVEISEQPNQELLAFIKALRQNYKTAVLSNANHGVLERVIPKDILDECFDALIVSAEVGMIKPDPKLYVYSAEKLGVDTTECVFIDDKSIYCDGAKAVNMQTIWYQNLDKMKDELQKMLAAGANN